MTIIATRHGPRRLVLLVLLLLAGCAGQGPTRSGFLSSYDGMAPTAERPYDRIFVSPAYVPAAFDTVVIDDVAWFPAADTPERTPEEIDDLRRALRERLVEELGKSFTVSEGIGPASAGPRSTLRVRAAVTNTRRANWWINAPAQLAFLPPPNPGGASVEIEVLDAESGGGRLLAVATYANGVPWSPTGYFTRFGHARRAFDLASELLREELTIARP
jgi:hypothetical protein